MITVSLCDLNHLPETREKAEVILLTVSTLYILDILELYQDRVSGTSAPIAMGWLCRQDEGR